MNTATLSASDARCRIMALADEYSWESIAKSMILAMSGDDARQHLEWLADEGFTFEE